MQQHLILFFYALIFIHSTIGYGFLFSSLIDIRLTRSNLGYLGLIGFFFIILISSLSSFFFAHGFFHNIILHFVGLIAYFVLIKKYKKLEEIKLLWILIFVLWIGIYVYKNHDDFPYYHLTYSLNLSENSFVIGSGNFGHGFRTFSSLFFFHSILYMPLVKFYLFHFAPFLILLFYNFIILKSIFERIKNKEISFIYYFSLLSFIFINIAFYRLAEHGTDRSAQILLVLIFILILEILYDTITKKKLGIKLNLLIILIFLASSMKSIYYLYVLIIPIVLFKKNILFNFFSKKNFLLIFIVSSALSLNIAINYLSTGCLLYPAKKTCIIEQKWSLPINEVERMSIHYEWWAKAGGGPGYSSKVEPKVYIKNFNWVKDWIDRHFFNKVLDTLLGLISLSFIFYFLFKFSSNGNKYKFLKKPILPFIIIIFFLVEWFFKHPSMRYGGYVLFAIPIFLFTSLGIQKFKININKITKMTMFLIIFSLLVFNLRNIFRIEKEVKLYNYDLIKKPFFFIKEVEVYPINPSDDFLIFVTKNREMCWAAKTPCSNRTNLRSDKFFWMNMVYKNEK